MLFCKHHFSHEKREGLMDPDPGGPKTWGYCGSGFPTLARSMHLCKHMNLFFYKLCRFAMYIVHADTLISFIVYN